MTAEFDAGWDVATAAREHGSAPSVLLKATNRLGALLRPAGVRD
jgi:hypothetical protein